METLVTVMKTCTTNPLTSSFRDLRLEQSPFIDGGKCVCYKSAHVETFSYHRSGEYRSRRGGLGPS